VGNSGTTASTSAIGVAVNNNFIGTIDARDIVMATSNLERMRISSGGNVGIGNIAPATLLHINGEHTTTRLRMTLPAAVNGGGTGDANLQTWVSEPCLTWEGAGIGVNINNDYTVAGCGVGGILMPKLNAGLGQAFIRFETNGGNMLFYTLNNATAPTGALAPRERMSINSAGNVKVNDLAGVVNRPVFINPDGTLRSASGGLHTATSGYALADGTAWTTSEGTVRVLISGNTLLVRAYNEGGTLLNTYTLNNVHNAKVVVTIINDDDANCGGGSDVKTSRPLVFTRTNGDAEQSQNSDLGCSGSDGHMQLIQIYYNPH
jgi:hypothetical protein